MPESDLPLDLLRAVADAGVSAPPPEQVRARVSSVIETEIRCQRRRDWPLIRATLMARGHVGRLLFIAGSAVPVVAVAAVLLLGHRSPTAPPRAEAPRSGATSLQRAFPVLTRPRTRADRLPRGHWFGGSEHLELKLSRLVLSRGPAKMWLIPTAAGDVCLVGRGGLVGGGCTTQAVAEGQGLFSAVIGELGATEVQGILPHGASLQVINARGRPSRIPINDSGAFAERLVQPAPRALITTPAGAQIPLRLQPPAHPPRAGLPPVS